MERLPADRQRPERGSLHGSGEQSGGTVEGVAHPDERDQQRYQAGHNRDQTERGHWRTSQCDQSGSQIIVERFAAVPHRLVDGTRPTGDCDCIVRVAGFVVGQTGRNGIEAVEAQKGCCKQNDD
jgi:hypothetical protein